MAASTKKKYHQGHDIKSLLLNLATLLVFILPVVVYIDREGTTKYCAIAAGALVIAALAPPFGVYRPHPYSDWENNKPLRLTKDD